MKIKPTKTESLMASVCAILLSSLSLQAAAVFPIADSSSVVQLCFGLAYDGSNYLAALRAGTEVGAQLISPAGTLIGPLVNVGSSSAFPPALAAAFGGGAFLEVWSDNSIKAGVDMFGQRISTAGAKLGARFPLLASAGAHGFQTVCALGFGGGNFLAVWRDGTSGDFYGQIVTGAGGLASPEFLISDQPQNGKSASVAFDGANFLVVWQSNNNNTGNDNKTYGAFISSGGSAGSPFQINQTDSLDQNPMTVAFDGTNYLVVWSKDTQVNANDVVLDWTLYGRFVSPGGALSGNEMVLEGHPGNQDFPNLAFDGQNYLLVWSAYTNGLPAASLRGQFFDRSANAVGPSFATLPPMGRNYPLLAVNGLVYDGSRFVLAGLSGIEIHNASGDLTGFAAGQVWGAFIPTSQTTPKIVTEPSNLTNLAGTTATLTVAVDGPDVGYQWFKNSAMLAASTRISGVNADSLAISNLALSDAGTYSVVASNLFGAAISSNATLTIVTPVTITTESSPLKVATLTGEGSYSGDSMVVVTTAATNECYYFTNWTVNGKVVSTDSTYAFTAVKSETLTANFLPVLYEVQTTSAPANGGTTSGGGAKDCGSTVTVTANAHAGFRFENWTAGATVTSTNASYEITPSGNIQLTANFVSIVPPTLTLTSPTGSETTTNSTLNLVGKTTDNVPVTNVHYTVSGSVPVLAQTANGWTNWSASVPLNPGMNVIQIVALASGGLQSSPKTIAIVRQSPPPPVNGFSIDASDTIKHPQAQIAFDGANYLVAFQTYSSTVHPNTSGPVAQFVSPSGQLVGSLLVLDPNGAGDPPWVAFDGNNYLTAWADYSDTQAGVPVRGAFVSPDGTVGGAGQLTQSTTVHNFNSIVFGGGVYFIMWSDSRGTVAGGTDIFGAMITPSGGVAASDFEISSGGTQSEAGQSPAAFDGTNFLAVWSGANGGTSIKGRLISTTGGFVTGPFVIFTNSAHIGAALNSVVFDGTKYLVLFTAETESGNFASAHIYGRFVTPVGEVLTNQITVTGDTGPQDIPCAAFDGTHYLVTWNQGFNPTTTASAGAINARLFDSEGNPVTAEFTLFKPEGNKIAVFAPVLFDGTRFFSAAGLGHLVAVEPNLSFTNGIISGAFVVP